MSIGAGATQKSVTTFISQREQIAGPKVCGMNWVPGLARVTEPRQTSKAKPPNLYDGLAKASRRSGLKAKVVVTQPFESRDNRAMALF